MASKKFSVAGKPGSDPTLPNVALTINEKVFQLCYDFNSIAEAENLTGINLLFSSMDFQNLDARKYRALLFAALLKGQPGITLDEAGALINNTTIPSILQALVEAWTGSHPEILVDSEKADKVNPPVEQQELPL
jgi:hypothetical protein